MLTTLRFIALVAVVISAAVASPRVLAEETNQAFLSISSPLVTSQAVSTTAQASTVAYISKQLTAYAITQEQLLALPIATQRDILSIEGIQRPLTREERRAIVPFATVVPSTVVKTALSQKSISPEALATYGVSIPNSVTQLPDGFKQVLLGNKLVVINTQNQVLGSTSL